ncbi:transcription antitermination factor NusB [Haliangium sp.]|uniref:transcription antitermination factor NusB n=1 Tax=Haliangium sp. TaxID=2663208 RepID=UPI003D0F095D
MGSRRRARGYALQVLYALDLNPGVEPAMAVVDCAERFGIRLESGAAGFASELVERVAGHLDEIDHRIQEVSRNWRLDRMSRVDRNVLRLATGELMYAPAIPVKVVINEAVELAKRFGASESAAFVNGILDRIAQGLRQQGDDGGD